MLKDNNLALEEQTFRKLKPEYIYRIKTKCETICAPSKVMFYILQW